MDVTVTAVPRAAVSIAEMGPMFFWTRPGLMATKEEIEAMDNGHMTDDQRRDFAQRMFDARERLLCADTSGWPS